MTLTFILHKDKSILCEDYGHLCKEIDMVDIDLCTLHIKDVNAMTF